MLTRIAPPFLPSAGHFFVRPKGRAYSACDRCNCRPHASIRLWGEHPMHDLAQDPESDPSQKCSARAKERQWRDGGGRAGRLVWEGIDCADVIKMRTHVNFSPHFRRVCDRIWMSLDESRCEIYRLRTEICARAKAPCSAK